MHNLGANVSWQARIDYTIKMVSDLHARNPSFNYIIVHPKHSIAFDGQKDIDWAHDHEEFDISIGGTIGLVPMFYSRFIHSFDVFFSYEIYAVRSGNFFLQGDGGFTNVSALSFQLEQADDSLVGFHRAIHSEWCAGHIP
jgi:hypothetical protein